MKKNKTISLSQYGFLSLYTIDENGKVYFMEQEIKPDKLHRIKLKDKNNKTVRIVLKNLYRLVFKKEYCCDNIQDIQDEEWKPIAGTNNRYFISSCGRVKSLSGYDSKILKPDRTPYLDIKIKKKHYKIHRLVAQYFCFNDNPKEKTIVHHKDFNINNNNKKNLVWLTEKEHKEIHNKKGTEKQ